VPLLIPPVLKLEEHPSKLKRFALNTRIEDDCIAPGTRPEMLPMILAAPPMMGEACSLARSEIDSLSC